MALAVTLPAQSPSGPGGDLILRSNTHVVQIDVSVRDAHGKPVDDLGKGDFTVTDNGKPRPFSIFTVTRPTPSGDAAPEVSAPATPQLPPNTFTNMGQPPHPPSTHSTVLLLDGIDGWFDNFALARKGVLGMLTKVPADEKIALYVIAKHRGLAILQDYTLDRAMLLAAMDKFVPEWMCPAPASLSGADDGMHDGTLGPSAQSRIKFAECRDVKTMSADVEIVRASFDALANALRSQPGRKSVFWVTQGFPPSLLRQDQSWNQTISKLNDGNVAVNTVDSNGLGGPAGYWGPGGTLSMMQLAERTGGTAYYHRNDLDAALAEGIEDARTGYTLGFYVTEIDGRYHHLKVSVNRPNLQLNYRQGYYAVDELKPDRSQKTAELTEALLNPGSSSEIGITATLRVKKDGPRGAVTISLKLTPDALSLKAGKTGKTGKVKELFVERNAAGKVVGQQPFLSQFEIGLQRQAAFTSHGITIEQTIQLPPGAVSLSIIVQDAGNGRMGSLTVPLEKVTPAKTAPSAVRNSSLAFPFTSAQIDIDIRSKS
jgi:VWFA-related protein